ncbi:MAG: hypothetical protein K2Y31_13855 [Burkholderiales bacterium]|nr:hypothetical protein [Burkholderiales bacterium]
MLGLQAITATYAAERSQGSLEAVRSLAQAGAVQLALHRIDTLQPQDAATPPWVEWENLRLQLLARLNRNDELLQHAGVLPSVVPISARAGLHAMAARAALTLGRTAVARDHAARALWSPGLGAGTLRELRLLVIQSYVRDARTDDAFRSMLRFEQDYRPLDAATARLFVDALLDLKLTREAVAWLTLLDERGPTKLRLRLHTGVVTPQDAVVQARAALGRSEDPAWWRILLEAADRQNNGALRIAALEQLLETKARPVAETPDADAARLWETYISHAPAAANGHQLLAGDDASWLEFALRRRTAEPAEARAYLAYLASSARDPKAQQIAQIRLAADFAEAKLPRTGLRVFAARPADAGILAVATRHTLGALAEAVGDPVRALQYWQGLPAPDGMPAAVWNLRLCALALRAGRTEAAIDIAGPLAVERSVISAVQLPEWITLAQQFTDHGLHDTARALFDRVLPYADAAQTRLVLSGIAQTHEGRGQPLQAAEFYLHSAMRAPKEVPLGGAPKEVPLGGAPKEVPLGGAPTDAAAMEARLQAGLNLVRAGLRYDAKAQFEWLLKNASDPAQIAVARRELGF